jgi:hypothetical protein
MAELYSNLYSAQIGKRLANQLTKFVSLNRHQLAGQVANLDFWLAEVRHCLIVIDGYGQRFERLKAAQMSYVSEHQVVEFDLPEYEDDDCCYGRQLAGPPLRAPARQLADARRSLCDAVYSFLMRCFKEGHIKEARLRKVCADLGIAVETRDLRAKP